MGLRERAEKFLRGYPDKTAVTSENGLDKQNNTYGQNEETPSGVETFSTEIRDEFGGDNSIPEDITGNIVFDEESNIISDELEGVKNLAGKANDILEETPDYTENDLISIPNDIESDSEMIQLAESMEHEIAAQSDYEDNAIGDAVDDDTEIPNDTFQDDRFLLEIAKEIIKTSSLEGLRETVLFSLMGYLSVEGVAIFLPEEGNAEKWLLSDSKGVRLKSKRITFKSDGEIFIRACTEDILYDIGRFKNTSSEEYGTFVSIGASVLAAVKNADGVKMLISIGRKMNDEEFSANEKRFICEVRDMVSLAVGGCIESDRIRAENRRLEENAVRLIDIDAYEEKIRKSGSDVEIERCIRDEMTVNGVLSFALFERDSGSHVFKIKFNDESDYLSLRAKKYSIPKDNAFTAYLASLSGGGIIENPINNEMLHRIFDEEMLARMNVLLSVPYVIRGRLTGFLLVLRAELGQINENFVQIKRFAKVVFSFFQNRKSIQLYTDPYNDIISPFIKKMSEDYDRAKSMNIPLAIASLTVKNYKRIYSEYGESDAESVISFVSDKITEKLSQTDSAVRFSRDSIMVSFPGKEKKKIANVLNSIRNEISEYYRKHTFVPMITHLSAEYPGDADDINGLLSEVE